MRSRINNGKQKLVRNSWNRCVFSGTVISITNGFGEVYSKARRDCQRVNLLGKYVSSSSDIGRATSLGEGTLWCKWFNNGKQELVRNSWNRSVLNGTVISVWNGISEVYSKVTRDCQRVTLLGKDVSSLSDIGMATSLGEEKLLIYTSRSPLDNLHRVTSDQCLSKYILWNIPPTPLWITFYLIKGWSTKDRQGT